MQGRCRRDGTTVFLDLATLEPFGDQWAFLSSLDRMTPRQVERVARLVRAPVVGFEVKRLVASSATRTVARPAPIVRGRLGARILVEGADLSPALAATLKHAASLANPAFHERQRQRRSTWDIPRFLQGYHETVEGNLLLPRGLLETLRTVVTEAGSRLEITDERADGTPLELELTATLRSEQQEALDRFAEHDLGLIVARQEWATSVTTCPRRPSIWRYDRYLRGAGSVSPRLRIDATSSTN